MALLQECVVGLIVCPSCAEDYGDLFSCSSQRGVNCLLLREENFQNVHAWMRLVRHKLLSLHWVNLSGCGQGDHRLEDRPEIIDLRASNGKQNLSAHLVTRSSKSICALRYLRAVVDTVVTSLTSFPRNEDSSDWSFGNISRRGIDTAAFWYCHNNPRYISRSGMRHLCVYLFNAPLRGITAGYTSLTPNARLDDSQSDPLIRSDADAQSAAGKCSECPINLSTDMKTCVRCNSCTLFCAFRPTGAADTAVSAQVVTVSFWTTWPRPEMCCSVVQPAKGIDDVSTSMAMVNIDDLGLDSGRSP